MKWEYQLCMYRKVFLEQTFFLYFQRLENHPFCRRELENFDEMK